MQNEADGAPNTAAWNALNAIRTPGSVDDTSGGYITMKSHTLLTILSGTGFLTTDQHWLRKICCFRFQRPILFNGLFKKISTAMLLGKMKQTKKLSVRRSW